MKIKIGKLTISIGTDCDQRECAYFTRYLAHGLATLSHQGFHAKEADCIRIQQAEENYYLEYGHTSPYLVLRCQQLEAEIRA